MSLLKSLFNENDKNKKEAGKEKNSAPQKESENKANSPKKDLSFQEVKESSKFKDTDKSEDFSIQKLLEEFSLPKNQSSNIESKREIPKEAVQKTGEQMENLQKQSSLNANSFNKTVLGEEPSSFEKPFLETFNSDLNYGRSAFSSFFTVTNRKLTIILLEDSKAMLDEKEKVKQIVNSVDKTGLLCIIKYDKVVKESPILEAKTFSFENGLFAQVTSDDACIFDALIALENVVDKNYMKFIDFSYKREKVNKIEIIGIGRAVDNCSLTLKEEAIRSFAKVSKLPDIATKYYCLTEENFLNAATIGFRSIGAFSRKFF